MTDARFGGRVLVLGAGSVSRCTVPLLIDHLVDRPDRITILDRLDLRAAFAGPIAAGASFVVDEVREDTLGEVLGRYVGPGDLLLDLAWNIGAEDILTWCHDHGVLYLNTSLEEWDPYSDPTSRSPQSRTLYVRHMRMRALRASWSRPGPTAVVEHGANPGLVSHWVKRALEEIGERATRDGLASAQVTSALADADHASLAESLGVRVIHISERDTQISDRPKRVDEFVNTWSVLGFLEEGVAPAEMGWGTHERTLPADAYEHRDGPRNQICIARPAADTWVRSWVPDAPIHGMVIRHGEAFTISEHLTTRHPDGTARYRPTVHYAYCPTDAAIASMRELMARGWDLQPEQRIMGDEIIDGEDRLGVLLMGHPYGAWWTGSLLSIHEARRHAPGQNATTLQVAAGILGALRWMVRNPDRGPLVPDDLPWREVMAVAEPFLGEIWSGPSDWSPLRDRNDPFEGWASHRYHDDDPWQFANFLLP